MTTPPVRTCIFYITVKHPARLIPSPGGPGDLIQVEVDMEFECYQYRKCYFDGDKCAWKKTKTITFWYPLGDLMNTDEEGEACWRCIQHCRRELSIWPGVKHPVEDCMPLCEESGDEGSPPACPGGIGAHIDTEKVDNFFEGITKGASELSMKQCPCRDEARGGGDDQVGDLVHEVEKMIRASLDAQCKRRLSN